MMLILTQNNKTIHFSNHTPKPIGAVIAEIMTKTGYPNDIMAEMLYISEKELEQIKTGVLIPTKEQTKEIFEHLGCKWSDLQ